MSNGLSLWWTGAVIAAVMSVAAGARADDKAGSYKTGNALYHDCESTDDADRNVCLGYVEAIADVLDADNPINRFTACVPDVTAGEVREVVRQFLAKNPAKLHLGASGLVAHALNEAFPCP